MLKLVLAGFVLSGGSVWACPNLEGVYSYPGSQTLSISQEIDSANITTYMVSIDDGNCAACHYDTQYKADDVLKKNSFNNGQRKESLRISCGNNRLQIRQSLELYNDNGELIYEQNGDVDYRINKDNDLAIEKIQNGEPVSKVVHRRLN